MKRTRKHRHKAEIYLVVIGKAPDGSHSAYVPDLPGCVSCGRTAAEARRAIRQAIRFHIDGLREDGLPVPVPMTQSDYVEAAEV